MAIKDINDAEQWQKFCKRLVEKTKADEIEWDDWTGRIGRPDTISPLFVAAYKDWYILVYKSSYKYYSDEDEFEWRDDVSIELITHEGKIQWTLPAVPARFGLLDVVQFKAANVETLLDDILKE